MLPIFVMHCKHWADVPHVENNSTCVMRFFRQDDRIVLDLYHFYPVILSNILYL